MKLAFLFPGQGAQKVGMCAAFMTGFKSGVSVIEEIQDAISFDIEKLISEGPIEVLTETQNAQVAIFAVTMACVAVLEKEYGFLISKNASYLAGHSLGEYSALCASGVISVSDCAKLVKFRGEVMSKASNSKPTAMVAVLGSDVEMVEKAANDYQSGRNICVIANDNMSTQVVLSGHEEAVKAVSSACLENGAKRVIKLATSGPFHSPLMASASIELDEFLTNNIKVNDFSVPVIMNVVAEDISNKEQVHDLLIRQVTGRVKWRDTMKFMHDNNIKRTVEIGPGKVLSGMIKRDYGDIDVRSIETVAEMEEFVKIQDDESN